MVRNCYKIINKIIILIKQLIYYFIMAQIFYKYLLCFWVEIQKSCYRNCYPGPSEELVPQIKPYSNSCLYPLINYHINKSCFSVISAHKFTLVNRVWVIMYLIRTPGKNRKRNRNISALTVTKCSKCNKITENMSKWNMKKIHRTNVISAIVLTGLWLNWEITKNLFMSGSSARNVERIFVIRSYSNVTKLVCMVSNPLMHFSVNCVQCFMTRKHI